MIDLLNDLIYLKDMKTDLVRKIYFNNAEDKDLDKFTIKFLSSDLLWVYIALHPRKRWDLVFERLNKKDKALFVKEYNKAFLFTRIYRILVKFSVGHEIKLINLFLPSSANNSPELFVKAEREDDMRWKEIVALIS